MELGNGLLERAPVVPSSKIYATGETKRMERSFSDAQLYGALEKHSVIQKWLMTDE